MSACSPALWCGDWLRCSVVGGLAYRVMLRDYPDVLNIDQMCEILSVSTKTGYAILKKGSVQHLKVGRSYRIPKAHLLTYLIGFAPGHTIRA